VKKNCHTEKCEEINIKSTHTDIAARIYDISHIEVEEPDYVIVYSRAFVENKNFKNLDSIIAPCNTLPIEFQKDGLLIEISFELLDCCNLFTVENQWGESYGCKANILEINHLGDKN